MELRPSTTSLALAEDFAIARGSRTTQEVVRVEVEHDGLVGRGEAAPVYYRGESASSALAFLRDVATARIAETGSDPFDLEGIGNAVWCGGSEAAARAALDAALHDWVGRRLGVPLYRLLGLSHPVPPTSYTIGIDSVEGTRDRARRAREFAVLKVKVGGTQDLERLAAVREESTVPLRVDANEGWTLESARELLPALVELGVELIEQPFPAEDLDSFRALRELSPRPPIVVDEGCHDLRDVAKVAGYADAINIKLAKSGGVREAVRMAHAARALGLGIMLGCMVESQLAVAPATHIASLAAWVDLDGHLLLAEQPFVGLELRGSRVMVPADAPGLGVEPA